MSIVPNLDHSIGLQGESPISAPRNLQGNPCEAPVNGDIESVQAEPFPEDEEARRDEPEEPGFWTVAINIVDRACGGPEEGGWWFDCGEPALAPRLARWTRVFTNEDEACAYGRRLNETVAPRHNRLEKRRDRNSVISDGEYGAIVHEGYPAAWPESRPHYE